MINKVRALGTWYTKGFENGSHLRVAINRCESLAGLRETICAFFFEGRTVVRGVSAPGSNPCAASDAHRRPAAPARA